MVEQMARRRRLAANISWMLGLAGLALVLSGCATPVGVKHVDIQTAYRLQTENALSAGQPSEPSKTVLRRLGLLDRFDEEPAKVLAELHGGLSPTGDDDRLFALARGHRLCRGLRACAGRLGKRAAVNPGHIPFSRKVLASGYAPEYVYERGRLDQSLSFEDLKERSHINAAARAADQASDFSRRIRADIP